MAHPLALKYGEGDPKAWDADKRAQARAELHDVLGKGEGGKRLKGPDRIELMRIWLAIIAADHTGREPESTATPDQAKQPRRFVWPTFPRLKAAIAISRSLSVPDYLFITLLCGITIAVLLLGTHSVREVLRMEDVKKEAEDLVTWFKTSAEERKKSNFEPAACGRGDSANWKECYSALTAENGPLHGKVNAFEQGRALLSRKCDQQDVETIGTISIEKGAIAPGSSTYSYTPFDGTEPLNKDYVLRVLVCGRGFHLIKVQNELSW